MVPPAEGFRGNAAALKTYRDKLMQQPAPCLIFRGQGYIYQEERDPYPEGLVVLFQPKAWVDRPTAMAWMEKVMEPFIMSERESGVATASTRYLLLEDNLDS